MPWPCEHEATGNMHTPVVNQDKNTDSFRNEIRLMSSSIAQTFGNDRTSAELAHGLRKLFPRVEFVRASLRSGSGLFVTDNLLHQGRCMKNLVSFQNSLSAECMERGDLVVLPPSVAPYGTDQTVGNQNSIAAIPAMAHGKPIGAIIVGAPENYLEGDVLNDLNTLAEYLGEILELVGQCHVSHMADLLALREQDSAVFGAEESLQDLPMNTSYPFGSRIEPEAKAKESEAFYAIMERVVEGPLDTQPSWEILDEDAISAQGEILDTIQEEPSSVNTTQEESMTATQDEVVKELATSFSAEEDDDTLKKPQMDLLPEAMGVRGFGLSAIYILATMILMCINPDKSLSGSSLITLVCSIAAFASSVVALIGSKKNWIGKHANLFVAAFCVIKFLSSSMDAFAVEDDVISLKHNLLQAMVVFESSLLLCMGKGSVSYGAHVAACASLTIAMALHA
jgi:hypothetical protein